MAYVRETIVQVREELLQEWQTVEDKIKAIVQDGKLAQKSNIVSLKISFAFKIIFSKQFVSLCFE
jgi:hypothetical protein